MLPTSLESKSNGIGEGNGRFSIFGRAVHAPDGLLVPFRQPVGLDRQCACCDKPRLKLLPDLIPGRMRPSLVDPMNGCHSKRLVATERMVHSLLLSYDLALTRRDWIVQIISRMSNITARADIGDIAATASVRNVEAGKNAQMMTNPIVIA